ncbi:MAG: RING finger domain-containing protein [Candidatus Thorarchaeota archaeon]
MKCAICKLEIREGQKLAQCTNCLAVFHEELYSEWINDNKACPVCSMKEKPTIKIETMQNLKQFSTTNVENEEQLNEMKYYTRLQIAELSEEAIFRFIKSNNDFGYSLRERSEDEFRTFFFL